MRYGILLTCGLALAMSAAPAAAEELTHEEMVCALEPQCETPFADRRLRGVTTTPSVRPANSFDVTVNFALNSADLTPDARAKLSRVAKALTDPRTSSTEVVISGHTDARGGADYNQTLSERRAAAVRSYLVGEHGIDARRLDSKGYGKSQLLLPSDPNNDLNRRVQFQNAGNTKGPSVAPAATTARPVATTPAAARPGPATVPQGDGL